ncbi:hypothetical protein AMTRI_Chr06g195940 [Amborella trichopoda]
MCLSKEESNPHLFIHYELARNFWSQLSQLFGFQRVTPPTGKALISSKHASHWPKAGRTLWKASIAASIWVIWVERNTRIFQGHKLQVLALFHKVTTPVTFWASNHRVFSGLSANTFLSQWENILHHHPRKVQRPSNWLLPPEGTIKLNFDGCSLGEPRPCRSRRSL